MPSPTPGPTTVSVEAHARRVAASRSILGAPTTIPGTTGRGGAGSIASDLDAYRTANVLLTEIGEKEAWAHATARALDLHLKDDVEGRAFWQQTLKALHELTRGKSDGERVQ